MIPRTDSLRGGLLLALSLTVGLGGCGGAPPVLDSKVVRAPRIALREAKVVALEVTEATCADLSASEGSPETAPVEASCAGTPFSTDLVAQVRARVKARLTEAGFTLADKDTPPDATLRGTVAIVRERRLGAPDQITDEALCKPACGQAECLRAQLTARLSIVTTLNGPPGPDGAPQNADGAYAGNGLADPDLETLAVHLCAPGDAAALQDETHVDWARANREALDQMDEMSVGFFRSWREVWAPALLTDVAALSDGRSGLEAGEAGDWVSSEQAFREALTADDAEPLRGHLLHNVAAVVLAQQRLDDAKTAITEGLALTQDESMTQLAAEIDRRLADRAKLAGPAVAAETTETPTAAVETPVASAEPGEETPAAAVEEPPVAAAEPTPPAAVEETKVVAAEAPAATVEEPPAVAAEGTTAAGEPCFVAGRKVVKFRTDASHKAKPTGLVPAGTAMLCYEVKAGWRRVAAADGSASGYLPEYLVGRAAK